MTVEEFIVQASQTDITPILEVGKLVLAAYVVTYAVLFLVLAVVVGKIFFRR